MIGALFFQIICIGISDSLSSQSSRTCLGAGESIKKVTFAKTDANLNTTIGSYVVNLYASDCLNYPSGLKDFVILEVFVTQREETLYILQRLTGFSGRIYTRSKVAAEEWSNWVMI